MKNYKKRLLEYLIEIIIIVIGVLAAFYLSNWGNSIQKSKTENQIISQIYYELKVNLSDLENDFVIHDTGLRSHIKVEQFLDQKRPFNDSLQFDLYWLTRDEYVFASTSGFENLKSMGMELIKDEVLKNLISLVYNNDLPRLTRGKTINPDINEFLMSYYKTYFSTNRDTSLKYTLRLNDSLSVTYPLNIGLGATQFIGYRPLNWEELLEDEEFRFLLSKALEYRIYKYNQYRRSINHVKQVFKLIENQYPQHVFNPLMK